MNGHCSPEEKTDSTRTGAAEPALVAPTQDWLDEILRKILMAAGASHGAIFLLNFEETAFWPAACEGIETPQKDPIAAANPVIQRVKESMGPIWLQEDSPPADLLQIGAVLILPVDVRGRLIGILCLGPKRGEVPFREEDVRWIREHLQSVAFMIATARSDDLAHRLQALSQAKDKFLSWISHELRTPMTGIMGYASLLRTLVSEEKPKRYLNIIVEQVEKLTELMDTLLDIQRFSEGRASLDLREIDLEPVIRQAVDGRRNAFKDKAISLEEEFPDSSLQVLGDPDRLAQALTQILSNAAKFAPQGGRVVVRVASEQGYGRVSVSDNGPGVPPDKAEHIFSPYQATGWSTREKGQGAGLGLPLAHAIILHHRGRIGVLSEPGSGSEFFFEIPLREASLPQGGP